MPLPFTLHLGIHRRLFVRRSALLGGEQRPGNSAGQGSAEFAPGELPVDLEDAGDPGDPGGVFGGPEFFF